MEISALDESIGQIDAMTALLITKYLRIFSSQENS